MKQPLSVQELKDNYIFFRALTGSHAYGLNHAESDMDWRGWYAPPTHMILGLSIPPEQLEYKEDDATFWEIRKFVHLLLKNNPNVLETLWAKEQIYKEHPVSKVAREIVASRRRVLCTELATTYGGYATSQWRRGVEYLAKPDMERQGWKHLMHLCRLLISGTFALKEGDLLVDVGEHRDRLLTVRRGEMTFDDVCEWRDELEAEFSAAKANTVLPNKPDTDYFNGLLIEARTILMKE